MAPLSTRTPTARFRLRISSTDQLFPGVGAQIMGANDKYLWQFDENVEPFRGSRHELALGHTCLSKGRVSPPKCELNSKVTVMQPPNPNL